MVKKKKVLIFGAGSIGNHFTNACLKINAIPFVTDISFEALIRMKKKIFPSRYKKWSNKIQVINYSEVFKLRHKFDLIIIGTPPLSHLKLYKECKKKLKFKKILIEKPLCTYKENFYLLKNEKNIYCGYNHSVSDSFLFFLKKLKKLSKKNKKIITIKWQESFKGILGAHFWLKNEYDSYLGDLNKGGGAIHEHSHGLHLGLCILKFLKIKNYKLKSDYFFKEKKNFPKYDVYSNIKIYNKNLCIIIETDLLNDRAQKMITAFDSEKKLNWIHSASSNFDRVEYTYGKKNIFKNFKKTRSLEFETELKEIFNVKDYDKYKNSTLNIKYAIEVMKIISKTLQNAKKI